MTWSDVSTESGSGLLPAPEVGDLRMQIVLRRSGELAMRALVRGLDYNDLGQTPTP